MAKSSNVLRLIHFADDTTALVEGDVLDELCSSVNQELDKIDKWLRCNKLSLNINKTSYMIITNKVDNVGLPLLIRDVNISITESAKFLGIIVDRRISFSNHIMHICQKVSKSCGILRKLSPYVPLKVLRLLYLSLVYPYLLYGVEVWGASAKTKLNRLYSLQNKCIRLVTQDSTGSIPDLYLNLQLLPLDKIHKYFVHVRFYQYYALGNNEYFAHKISENRIVHDHNTRSNSLGILNCPPVLVSRYYSSFLYRGIKFWNELPLEIKQTLNIMSFKRLVKGLLLSQPAS
jgi:hypothetical protein